MGTNRKYINRVLYQFQLHLLVIKWQQSLVSSKITLQKILMRLRESNSRPQHYYQFSKEGLKFPKHNAYRSLLLLYIALSLVFKNISYMCVIESTIIIFQSEYSHSDLVNTRWYSLNRFSNTGTDNLKRRMMALQNTFYIFYHYQSLTIRKNAQI